MLSGWLPLEPETWYSDTILYNYDNCCFVHSYMLLLLLVNFVLWRYQKVTVKESMGCTANN